MTQPPNFQTDKGLSQFQKLIVQDLCITQLNKWLGELEWEIEKKDTIISNKDEEITFLTKAVESYQEQLKVVKTQLADVSDRYRRATSSGKRLLVKSGTFPR